MYELDQSEKRVIYKFIVASEILQNPRYLRIFITLNTPINLSELSKLTNTPKTSVFKFLKKLLEANLITRVKGINKKKVYYTLTPEGSHVAEYLRNLLLKQLENVSKDKGVYKIQVETLEKTASKLGISTEILANFIKAQKHAEGVRTYYVTKS